MKCKHANKKLVDWSYSDGIHNSVHLCEDCGKKIPSITTPFFYDYPPKMVSINGVEMHKEDADLIMQKEEEIKRGKL